MINYHLKDEDKEVYAIIQEELNRQRNKLEMIASENIVSYAVMEAQGSVLTNKYAEGYPGKRYYGGCEYVDKLEQLAIDRARELFGADHVNVQPHSGSQANFAVYYGLLNPGDTVLGMNLTDGGHLTHGSPVNVSGNYFNVLPYGVREDDELLDYDAMEKLAKEVRPKMIIGGTSAYSRIIDFERMAAVAHEVGALLMIDMAHFAGLVAGGEYPSPVPWADIVTTTTHKTLRGPRGGIIMCKEEYAKAIDKAVFPGMQGGPLEHVIAAKAVAFGEDLSPAFKEYAKQVKKNEKVLSDELQNRGVRVISGGTDTHVLLADMRAIGITGKTAQTVLDEIGITANKNTIPFETLSPFVTSGIRLGSPALTTRGLVEEDFKEIADIISTVVKNTDKDENGMWGWGSVIHELFDTEKISVENHAKAGRSARTYLDEGRWDKIYHALQPGDFVLIQFGHNDAGDINTGKARAELPGSGNESKVFKMEKTGSYQVVYSFGWYLRKFIMDVKEKGAVPIVLSHTPRNKFDNGEIERNTSSFGKWTREAAEAAGAYFIDLNKISGDKLQDMGYNQGLRVVGTYFNHDHTHTSLKGARMNARSIADGLKATDCPLKDFLK